VSHPLPASVSGTARLLRDGKEVWSDSWLSGEDNMAHSLANLEQHHFKYHDFRRPGDVHVHFFGAATGSFTKNVKTQLGDVFEIVAPAFGQPLRNTMGPTLGKLPAPTMSLVAMGVSPAFRRAGVGHHLLDEFERRAVGMKMRSMHLSTESDNTAAQQFYERHGWLPLLKSADKVHYGRIP
jgi:GNAT superfamily N-acetyltransferase